MGFLARNWQCEMATAGSRRQFISRLCSIRGTHNHGDRPQTPFRPTLVTTLLLVAFYLTFGITNAWSQPNIQNMSSSIVKHGTPVTIYGSNFGIKSPAAPLIWDDFEDGIDPGWTQQGGMELNSDNQRHVHSIRNTVGDYSKTSRTCFGKTDVPSTVWYGYYWFKFGPNFKWGEPNPDERYPGQAEMSGFKTFRLWPTSVGSDNFCNSYVGPTPDGYPGGYGVDLDVLWRFAVELGQYSGGYGENLGKIPRGVWHLLEMQYSASSGIDKADGKVKFWFNGRLIYGHDNLVTATSAHPTRETLITRVGGFAMYWAYASESMKHYSDDLYVDTTWARVIIGDAPTFSTCTRREVQVPAAWSSTSITVTANQGSFYEGQPVYLYVIDEDGSVNEQGYQISFGQPGADTTPPYTTGHAPAKGATDAPTDTNISLHIKDSWEGVDESSISMTINGQKVTPTITGNKADYFVTYDPPQDCDYNQTVAVTVDASDLVGNVMPRDSYTFITDRPADTNSPIISNVTATDISSDAVTITWDSDEPATSQIEYGLTTSYGKATALDSNLVTSHSVSFAGLAPETTYHFRVISQDASGNIGHSADFTFTTPQLAATYEQFNEFCLANFGAEKEELVYAMFGPDLSFTEDGFWLYESESSASVAFETSLPAKTYVEYGQTTSYGKETQQSERYFYLHVYYLRDLQPGTTYHYRLIAIDERGNRIVSGDRTLTTRTFTNVVHISSDLGSPPYVLDNGGITYLLTEDIVADTKGFEIKGDNIVLDLNGHTVTYDDGLPLVDGATSDEYAASDQATFGIRIYGDFTGLKILNGRIKQGSNRGQGQWAVGFNPIFARWASLEIAGVSADWSGGDVGGMIFRDTGSIMAHHNVFVDKGTFVPHDYGLGVEALEILYSLADSHVIHHNLVKRTRDEGLVGWKNSRIYANEVYVDSWCPDSYAILAGDNIPGDYGSSSDNCLVYENRMFGTGYHPIGTKICYINSADRKYYNNFIHIQANDYDGRRNDYGEYTSAKGIRLKKGPAANIEFSGNTVVVKGTGTCWLRGLWLHPMTSAKNIVFRDNIIKVIAEDSEADGTAIAATGIGAADSPLLYENNKVISNTCHIMLGDGYTCGWTHRFSGTSFVKVGADPRYRTITCGATAWVGEDSYGHVLIDSTFDGGATYDNVTFGGTGKRDFSVGWTLTINTDPEATVIVQDKNGQTVFSGVTAQDGRLTTSLLEYTAEPTGRRYFTPHAVSVLKVGYQTNMQTVELSEPRELIITLNPGTDGTPPVLSDVVWSDITYSSVWISWRTDELSTSEIEYGLDITYGARTSLDADLSTSHSVSLSGLMAGNTYHFRVRSRDFAGNEAVSRDYTFVTKERSTGTFTEEWRNADDADHPGTVRDTYINIDDVNYSTEATYLCTYTWPENSVANAILMKFDLSALPTDAAVSEATLRLYMFAAGTNEPLYDLPVHKIINKNPVISHCTGYTCDGTNPWTPHSGLYDNIPLAQSDIAPAEDTLHADTAVNEYKTWTITNMVRDWVADPSRNYGLLINSDSSAAADAYRFFRPSEYSAPAQRPSLVITYTIDGRDSLAIPKPRHVDY